MMAMGNGIISSETLRGMSLEEYERTIYRAMEKEHHCDEYREPFVGSGPRGRCHDWTVRDMNGNETLEYPSLARFMKVGNRQEGMMPVEYRGIGIPVSYGHDGVRTVGDIVIDDKVVGDWRTTIYRKHLDVVEENLDIHMRKEKDMKVLCLWEVYIMQDNKFASLWRGVADDAETARLKAFQSYDATCNIDTLGMIAKCVGTFENKCCK